MVVPTRQRKSFVSVLTFEELHRTLVILCLGSARESAEVPTTARAWVNLSRVQTVLTRLQLPNHVSVP
jgi:hypothetical protein